MKALCKRGRALLLALALVLSLTAPALAAETEAPAAALASEVAELTVEENARIAAESAMTYGAATSIQYALWDNGEIVLSGNGGVYSKTEDRVLTDDILYGVGSVSKIYTTVAVMQLAEKHKLFLDAPVTRYLPDFKMADPRYRQITVRMLLSHSSGLMGSSFKNAMLFGDADPAATDELLERLAAQRLKADPGAYSVYCNDGFTLAELVVEAVSGQDFMEYVRANILRPAGLESTFAPGDDFDTARLAKTYFGADTRALPEGGMVAFAGDPGARFHLSFR